MDPLRLYLVKEVAYGGDGDFTWERLGEKYNADLANNLGNLVSRVSAMRIAIEAVCCRRARHRGDWDRQRPRRWPNIAPPWTGLRCTKAWRRSSV